MFRMPSSIIVRIFFMICLFCGGDVYIVGKIKSVAFWQHKREEITEMKLRKTPVGMNYRWHGRGVSNNETGGWGEGNDTDVIARSMHRMCQYERVDTKSRQSLATI